MPMLNSGMAESPAPQSSPAFPLMARESKQGRLLLAISLFAALVIYVPTLWFGPVYDDSTLLLSNPLIRSWSNIPFFFTHHMWTNVDASKGAYYRPLNMAVLIATGKLLGVRIWSFHLVSVLLFLLMTASVYLLARELDLSSAAAGWAAVLFAVHPLHIEVAAWATTGIGENLATLPFVLALAFYRRAQKSAKWVWFLASMGAYVLALLAKESTVILPALALCLELLWRQGKKQDAGIRLVAVSVITAAYLMIRASVLGELARTVISVSWQTTALTIPSMIVFYFRQVIFPRDVSLFYDAYYVQSWTAPQFLLPTIALLALLALAVLGWKRKRLTRSDLFCVLAAFLCLAPVLNLRAFPWREFEHDRYVDLTSLFLGLLLASMVSRMAEWKTAILGGVALFLALQTEAQVWNFRDELAAFSHASLVAPNNANALGRYAFLLFERGRHADAKVVWHRVITVAPLWREARYDLAQAEFQDGNLAEAEKLVRDCIALDPKLPQQHYLLAEILKREGRDEEVQRETRIAQGNPK